MARKKKSRGMPIGLSGGQARQYGGGVHPDNMGRKQSGLKTGRHHGASRKQRKIASGRM